MKATANLTNTKPAINANNYMQLVSVDASFDFNSANKIIISRVLQDSITFKNNDSLTLTIFCSFDRNTSVEFGARVFVDGVQLSTNQGFGLSSFNGSSAFDQVTKFVSNIILDNIDGIQTFNAGQILTIELFTRQTQTQTLTTRILCGVSSENVDRQSYLNVNLI